MIQLLLNVRCETPGTTLHVTSNHLEIYAMRDNFGPSNTGEEVLKRGEDFGLPVSKSMVSIFLLE